MIVSDNSTELTCNAVLAWCSEARINWHYIAPGKPMQMADPSWMKSGGHVISEARIHSIMNENQWVMSHL